MKRILVAVWVSLVLGTGGVPTSWAFQRPAQTPLPDYDVRRQGQPAPAALSAAALADLQARVPDLDVSVDSVLGVPRHFNSRVGYLTGPGGEGLTVRREFLQAFPREDRHRVIRAFLSEHAGLLGYGPEALDHAVITRDYVTAHNGLRTTVWQQQVDGIPVFGTVLMGHITKAGELVNLTTLFIPEVLKAADAGVKDRAALLAALPVPVTKAVLLAAKNVGVEKLSADQITVVAPAKGADKQQKLIAPSALVGETDARLVWFPRDRAMLRLCWQIILARGPEMFTVLVDAENGEVLLRRNQTRYLSDASYRVYVSDSPSPFTPGHPVPSTAQPPLAPRFLITTNAYDTNASPLGWINDGDNILQGNNVDAFVDTDFNGQPDQPRTQGNPFRVFDFVHDLTRDPTTSPDAAATQLFFVNNRYHDQLYALGFTEAAGNFQNNNFGRGGLGNDAITAVCQATNMFNNAFMQVTPDGVAPRMAMLIFTGPTPRRDTAFDAEVILHEHTHGLTERTLGGGVGVNYFGQSGAIHEGNSDWFGMTVLSEPQDNLAGTWPEGGFVSYDIIPNFRENYYYGIRRYPYCTDMRKNPLTYKDIDPNQASPHAGVPLSPLFSPFSPVDAGEVHNAGEVWCSALWEVRANLVLKHGWAVGNPLVLQLVLDGMRLSPPNPNFLELRDAILQADRVNNNAANHLEIWAGFAKRGMGGSATSPPGDTTVGVVEAFDVPGVAVVSAVADDTITGNANGAIDYNECNLISVLLRNGSTGPISNIVATLFSTNPLVTVAQAVSAYPAIPPGGSAMNLEPFRIYTAPAFSCGSPVNLGLVITTTADTRTNYFTLRSGFLSRDVVSFTNSTPLVIPDNRTNGAISTLNVAGILNPIGKVVVSLHITHPVAGDLALDLISPDGTTVNLVQRRGGFAPDFGLDCTFGGQTTFDDRARTAIGAGTPPFVGSYRPEEPLLNFGGKSGTNVNGGWRLRVSDLERQNTGTLQCWTLSFYQTECQEGTGPCAGDLALTATAAPEPVVVGSNLTYTLVVTNHRPISAAGVVLTNRVPSNCVFVAATTSQGTVTNYFGLVTYDLGTVSNGAVVIGTLTIQPTVPGVLTNVFRVSTTSGDADPFNNRAVVYSTVITPTPLIVPGGARLLTESFVPANHGIEPGETVTVNLGLRNIGSAPTTNLIASLQSGDGVTALSGPVVYDGIQPLGQETKWGQFTLRADGAPGSVVTATLQLYDGLVNLGAVSFPFTLSGSGVFGSTAPIIINDANKASPYPSVINVSNLVGALSKVTVSFAKFTHTFPDDVDALLVAPDGQRLVLLSDAGGNVSVTNVTLTFDQGAAQAVPDGGPLATATYRPANYETSETFPAPAPLGPSGVSLDALKAINPNGAWSLYIVDDTATDSGAINGGWALTINTVTPVDPSANLVVGIADAPDPVVVGGLVTYTIFVTNVGPDTATALLLTNTLSPGLAFVSAETSQGAVVSTGSVVVVDLGPLGVGSNAVVTVVATVMAAGPQSGVATAGAAELDLNPGNNTATASTTAINAAADLVVMAFDAPDPVVTGHPLTYTITVSNAGPQEATGVRLTNNLPTGLSFTGATASQGAVTNVGGVVFADLGNLPAGASAVVTIEVVPQTLGAKSLLVRATAATSDPVPANNQVTVSTTVQAPSPAIVTAGAVLAAEGFSPPNNAIEPGETVTLDLALRNSGTANTTNLVATLRATNGVILSAGPQVRTYGVLPAGGPPAAQPFTFTASTTNGDSITVVLALQDGAANLGTVSFTLPLSIVRTFGNPGLITINQFGAASPYPSTILVSNLTQAAAKVKVTISRLTHSFLSDVDMLLVGPNEQKVLLLSDAGGDAASSDITLTFDDDAASVVPASGPLPSGTYKPTDHEADLPFPGPAPAAPYSPTLSVFGGLVPNGTWSLYVADDQFGDDGRIEGGWSLSFVSPSPLPGAADLAVAAVVAPASAPVGSNVIITVGAVNHGPSAATGVTLTNELPAGLFLVSAMPSKGSLTRSGNTLVCNVGSLAVGENFTLTLNVIPTTAAAMTNVAVITGSETDPNPANNVAVTPFGAQPPRLYVVRAGPNVLVIWPNLAAGYLLESSPDLGAGANWQPDSTPVIVVDNRNIVQLPAGTGGNRFFRLRKPGAQP